MEATGKMAAAVQPAATGTDARISLRRSARATTTSKTVTKIRVPTKNTPVTTATRPTASTSARRMSAVCRTNTVWDARMTTAGSPLPTYGKRCTTSGGSATLGSTTVDQ